VLPGRNQWSVRNLGESSSARKLNLSPSQYRKVQGCRATGCGTWCHGTPEGCLPTSRYIPLFPIFNNYIIAEFPTFLPSLSLSLCGKYFLLFFFYHEHIQHIVSFCLTIQHILKSMDCEITAWRNDSLLILAVLLFSCLPFFFFSFPFSSSSVPVYIIFRTYIFL